MAYLEESTFFDIQAMRHNLHNYHKLMGSITRFPMKGDTPSSPLGTLSQILGFRLG